MNIRMRSRIKEYFPVELLLEINDITMSYDFSINEKGEKVVALLTQYGLKFDSLGSGTNRYGILIDGYAFKIALDQLGKNDNLREFKYAPELQPYVIKVYETTLDGLVASTEYVKTFKSKHLVKYEDRMREILSEISKSFLIGDVGISSKCSENWGRRSDGTICIMDFAYIFSVSFKKFECKCGNMLQYDDRFVDLLCPKCGYRTTFETFRNKISTKDEEDELGDVTEHAYIQKTVYQIHEVDAMKTVKSTQQLLQEEMQRKKQEKKATKKELKRQEREKDRELENGIIKENHFTVEEQEKLLEEFNREVGEFYV